MKNKQSGQALLVEMVMVIIIMGILASVAVPKYMLLERDARMVEMQEVEVAMRDTNAIIYTRATTENLAGSDATVISILGTDVSIAHGYAADLDNLIKVMDISPALGSTYATIKLNATGNALEMRNADSSATCSVTYDAPIDAGSVATYTLDISNCE